MRARIANIIQNELKKRLGEDFEPEGKLMCSEVGALYGRMRPLGSRDKFVVWLDDHGKVSSVTVLDQHENFAEAGVL